MVFIFTRVWKGPQTKNYVWISITICFQAPISIHNGAINFFNVTTSKITSSYKLASYTSMFFQNGMIMFLSNLEIIMKLLKEMSNSTKSINAIFFFEMIRQSLPLKFPNRVLHFLHTGRCADFKKSQRD